MKKYSLSSISAAVALAASAALLAACASSGSSTASTSGASTVAAAAGGSIATASGAQGSYLVDGKGLAIYILTSDKPGGATACTTECLKFWPAVAAPNPLPSGVSGVTATFGTSKAVDGSSELTINGYPAYTFAGDSGPGATKGQGQVSFGGTWWLVTPSGSWITAGGPASAGAGSSPAPAPSSASSSKSGGAYGY